MNKIVNKGAPAPSAPYKLPVKMTTRKEIDESRGGSSRKNLGGPSPLGVKKKNGVWGRCPGNVFLTTPFFPLENALFEHREWPFIHEEAVSMEEYQRRRAGKMTEIRVRDDGTTEI